MSALGSPLFGLMIDKTGKNVSWVLVSPIGSLVAHGLNNFTYLTPYLSIIIMGMSYSILSSALWSLPALLIPERQLGTAFGIMQVLIVDMSFVTFKEKHGHKTLGICKNY